MKITKNYFNQILVIFFCLLIAIFPWEIFRNSIYGDRLHYYEYITFYENKIFWFEYNNFLSLITYEWLWHYLLNFFYKTLNLSTDSIFFIISFIVSLAFSIFLYKKNSILAILLIVNPIFIDFSQSQLRSALALGMLTIAYLLIANRNFLFALLFLIPSIFIHTSATLFIFIALVNYVICTKMHVNSRIKFILSSVFGIFLALITGPLRYSILSSVGDRRAEYNDMSSPILYLIFWIALYFIFLIQVFKYKIKISVDYAIAVSILALIVSNIIFSGYSGRFIAASYPFLILSMFAFTKTYKQFTIFIYIFYTIILWVFWAT